MIFFMKSMETQEKMKYYYHKVSKLLLIRHTQSVLWSYSHVVYGTYFSYL